MGQAILYCSGCSTQLRDRDFEKGTAFRHDGRSYCSQCAPAEARSSVPPPARKLGEETNRGLKAIPAPATTRLSVSDGKSPKVMIIAGGGFLALVLILALAMSAKDPVRHPVDPDPPAPAPAPGPAPGPTPVPAPPAGNDRAAEEALRKARDFAQSRPDDLAGQLALFDAAVRASENSGHAVTAAREREAVLNRQKAAAKAQLEALDAALRVAVDKEDFGAALKLIDGARQRPMSPDWPTGLETRTQAVHETAGKLFDAVRKQAADARKKGAEDEVRRQTQRVEKWGVDSYRSDLAKAVAAATPKPKPPPPAPPKEIDVYRKKWSEAMTLAAGRDYAAAIRRIEDGKPSPDPAVQAETAADLELLRLALAAEEDAVQTLSKSPKGQKLTLGVLSETGQLVELSGIVVRADAQEIEIAHEKGSGPVPVGEVAARSLAQMVKARRDARGLAVFCLAEGDPEGAKTFVEQASAVPEKYWAHGEKLVKAPVAAEAAARRLFYLADHELQNHARAFAAAQRFAGLLKDQAETPFVHRNKPLLTSRAEGLREFFFLFEDLKAGGGFKAVKGEKDELYWKLPIEADPAKIADNFVELAFAVPADSELRCWVYVGGCCSESVTFSTLIADTGEPSGEPAPVKQSLSMPFRTHASHAGRGRPVPKWGWVQVPLPKFTVAGVKKVRLVSAQQNFCVAEAVVSATRQAVPGPVELKDLERMRTEARGSGRADPSLVAYWKFSDGSGASAADSSVSGLAGTLQNGAAWTTGTTTPWNPPALKLAGTAHVALPPNIPILQNTTAVTMSAWICADKLGGDKDLSPILSISRFTGATPTQESRATMGLANIGCLSVGARSADTDKGQGLRTTERLIKTGVWTHVAGVIDYPTNSITAYVNGVIQPMTGTAPKFGAKATPNTPSTCGTIGSEDDGTKWFFQGRVAELRVYNRALGKDEIAELAVPGASAH